jgi:hypothetical protein
MYKKTKKMKLKHILYLPLIVLVAIACQKEVNPSEFYQKWFECRAENNLDTEATYNKLVGEWKMIATGCLECTSAGVRPSDIDIKLVFTADSTLQVIEDGQVIRNSKFSIRLIGINEKEIETQPKLENLYIWGNIEFCGNKVGFIDSYRDGRDYFFERIEK